ncbi:hypothetical protein AXG93_685s1020 [Marchantia polymorpha subsp. ruderalis]|uniref:CCHC-type domain-containing protein n=1 Tax=Marchantia polymorpha subsp. ruderalis TaxID=1480154 RepID=A0A176WG09_MARPO|nr:hypothetical protein AXG93_685s1020 [Marchantia polymorpha subsp. ruderalis]
MDDVRTGRLTIGNPRPVGESDALPLLPLRNPHLQRRVASRKIRPLSDEKRHRKKAAGKKKVKRMAMPPKGTASMASNIEELAKDFAKMKVHVVGGQDRKKSPSRLWANLWCITCGKVGHANTECTSTRPNYTVNAVEWVQVWEPAGYYTDTVEETAYAIAEAPAPTPIPPAQIPRNTPNDMATTVPQRRMVPSGAIQRPAPNACYNYKDTSHYATQCSHPRRQMEYLPLCSNCRKPGHTAAECPQQATPRPIVRFVNPSGKDDVQVNQVTVSPERERKSLPTETRYQALQKRLAEEVEKQRQSEKVCEDLREDVERAKCASVDLLSRLEACRTTYDAESLKVDDLSASAEKKEQDNQIELAVRAKKLTEYEAVRISGLELIEKLEARCSKLRKQRSQAKEHSCEVETKLTEAERKYRQLFEETRDALTGRVEWCLLGYVLWQIESHNGLQIHEVEHCAPELIARSGRRHRRLAKKLESYL